MRRRRHGIGHRARGATPVVGSPLIDEDLAFALELADAADDITLARYRATDLVVETKPDLTPVTEADQAAEKALRARIETERPRDGVVGEEYGETTGTGGRRWILDPIDGTKSYVRGIPAWGTLIALERDGQIEVGVVSAPALTPTLVGVAGCWRVRRWRAHPGVACQRRRGLVALLHVVAGVREARTGRGVPCARSSLLGGAAASVTYWAHVLVAEGSADVAVEPVMNLWDNAPLQVIVEEAGGRFTDLEGRPRADGGSAVTTNGLLHEDVLAAMGRADAGT